MNKWENVTTEEINAVLQKQVEINKFAQLKNTFEFIHKVLVTQNYGYGENEDGTSSQNKEEVCKHCCYFDKDGDDTGTLILLRDKIEFKVGFEEDNYIVLCSQIE